MTIITAFAGIRTYVSEAQRSPEPEWGSLWVEHVIEPYWQYWGEGQLQAGRTRTLAERPVRDLAYLVAAVEALERSAVNEIAGTALRRANSLLPKEAPTVLYMDPLPPTNRSAAEGVIGACVGDNIQISINPFMDQDWFRWVPWVLAHEYHHAVWGYQYFVRRQQPPPDLLTALLIEGEADAFGRLVSEGPEPSWTRELSPEQERRQWQAMQPLLASRDPAVHQRFLFGDSRAGVPRSGYTIGYRIVQRYLERHPAQSVVDLLSMDAAAILTGSGYDGA